MDYKILTSKRGVSTKTFIEFWRRFYIEKDEDKKRYLPIKKPLLSKDDIIELYVWKNGMARLAHHKLKSVDEKIASKYETINELRNTFNEEKFNNNFNKISAIWKIFLLHIISSSTYPIFDQHVYRACFYLNNGSLNSFTELSQANNKTKEKLYKDEYLPFFKKIAQESGYDTKTIDEALMPFGQFIKSKYSTLFQPCNKRGT